MVTKIPQTTSFLRNRFTAEEMTDLTIVADSLGLTVHCWPLPVQDVLYAVHGKDVLIPQSLSQPYRRWAIANAIAHFVMHEDQPDRCKPKTRLGITAHRFDQERIALFLLVDLNEVERLGIDSSAQIAERFGIPEQIVDAYLASDTYDHMNHFLKKEAV